MSFDAIGIVTKDPKRAVEFYKLLGVDIQQYENSGHYEGKTKTGIRILLDTVETIQSFDPSYKKKSGNGITLCFKQDSPKMVDKIYEQAVNAGFEGRKSPWDAFWGQRYACIVDGDGNQIDLFASL